MIVQPKDLEYDLEKRNKLKTGMDMAISDGDMTHADASALMKGLGDPLVRDVHQFCFECGGRLHVPAVMWAGRDGKSGEPLDIWLHPQCAQHFAHRLLRDFNELTEGKEVADAELEAWKEHNPRA